MPWRFSDWGCPSNGTRGACPNRISPRGSGTLFSCSLLRVKSPDGWLDPLDALDSVE